MIKNYDSIDLLKFIASIFVVALHADAFYDISPTLNVFICSGIARLAVPIFFVVSSFFFFSKEVTWQSTKKYCRRLLTLYIAWFIVSLPKTIFDRFASSEYSIRETVFRFIRSFFFTSTFSGSWFIVSCIFCALIYYQLEKLQKIKRILITVIISVAAYSWCVFTSGYGKLLEPLGLSEGYRIYSLLFGNPYCSIIVGIPYFAVGRYFAKKYVPGRVPIKNAILSVVCVSVLLTEAYLTNMYNLAATTDCYVMLLPSVICLFPVFLSWSVKLNCAKTLRVASTIIFFSQFILLYICELSEWVLKVTIPCFGKFAFTVLCGLLLTWIILKLKDKRGFRWLRYFY